MFTGEALIRDVPPPHSADRPEPMLLALFQQQDTFSYQIKLKHSPRVPAPIILYTLSKYRMLLTLIHSPRSAAAAEEGN